MIGNIGFPELLVILVIALLLFGTRLPAVGKSLGEGIKAFKKGINNDGDEETAAKESKSSDERPSRNQRVIAKEGHLDRIDHESVVDVEHKDVHEKTESHKS